jgi:hypothetical protein
MEPLIEYDEGGVHAIDVIDVASLWELHRGGKATRTT